MSLRDIKLSLLMIGTFCVAAFILSMWRIMDGHWTDGLMIAIAVVSLFGSGIALMARNQLSRFGVVARTRTGA